MKATVIWVSSILIAGQAFADFSYKDSTRASFESPKLMDFGDGGPTALDKYKVVDLSANVGVGSSCGEMNVSTNLRSNLNDLMDDNLFKGLGNKIQSAGGMLALCYLSPSYCSIAKHMRMSAHFLSQLNLDSCALIDKYTDSRVSDYELSRQQCVRQTMQQNGQDVKAALEECGQGSKKLDLTDWSGGKKGAVQTNALIDSTAKWAGLSGDDASRIVDITKAFVGDTVVAHGGVEVEFGSRKKMTTPRELITEETKKTGDRLNEVIDDMERNDPSENLTNQLKNRIRDTFDGTLSAEMAVETARKLSFMPTVRRQEAVRSLSRAIAANRVLRDAEKSMEVLSLAARNPNLPQARQQEAVILRQQLKDSIDTTLELRRAQSDQLAQVLSSIHKEGGGFESDVSRRSLESEAAEQNQERLKGLFFDCSDNVFCAGGV